jgi:hypothetical protein
MFYLSLYSYHADKKKGKIKQSEKSTNENGVESKTYTPKESRISFTESNCNESNHAVALVNDKNITLID